MKTALTKQISEEETPHIAGRMATAIAARMKQNGQCRIADVRALGFSLNDIARYWPDACKLAEAKRPRPRRW